MMPIVFSMKIRNFSKVTLLKVTQFLSLSKVSLLKFSENAQKVLGLMPIMIYKKGDTFENYKSFVPVEVQSHGHNVNNLIKNFKSI